MNNFTFRFEQTKDNVFFKFDELFENVKQKFLAMDLTVHQSNEIVNFITQLVDGICETHRLLIDDNKVYSLRKVDLFHHRLRPKLQAISSLYMRRKEIRNSPTYVQPEEKAIGFKWKLVVDEITNTNRRRFEQNTFEYVPILETIKTELSDPGFWQIYENHNLNKDHICQDGIYRNVCCGSTQRSNTLLQRDPLALQIQLYTDEFEPCDPIKSKSGRHKVENIYNILKCNFFSNYLSKI